MPIPDFLNKRGAKPVAGSATSQDDRRALEQS